MDAWDFTDEEKKHNGDDDGMENTFLFGNVQMEAGSHHFPICSTLSC